MKMLFFAFLLGAASITIAPAADQLDLEKRDFDQELRMFRNEKNDSEKHRRAGDIIRRHRLTSLQVKDIATVLPNDDARLEFATMAYPRTIDPENFYEVYDAFTSFSKVMRLHDRVRPAGQPAPPVVNLPRVVTDDEIKDIIKALQNESFDKTKIHLARQIVTSSRSLFLSAQVKQMVGCFDFEPGKLEMAKLAYEVTFDKHNFYCVNEAFDFESTRQKLSSHIESWNKEHPPRP